jgi:hypothetical protein
MAQNNLGRPGMPPSPNQKVVLDTLANMCRGISPDAAGFRIDTIAGQLRRLRRGGNYMLLETGSTWIPWTKSTVRDHLNALEHRGHAQKKIIDSKAFFRI